MGGEYLPVRVMPLRGGVFLFYFLLPVGTFTTLDLGSLIISPNVNGAVGAGGPVVAKIVGGGGRGPVGEGPMAVCMSGHGITAIGAGGVNM